MKWTFFKPWLDSTVTQRLTWLHSVSCDVNEVRNSNASETSECSEHWSEAPLRSSIPETRADKRPNGFMGPMPGPRDAASELEAGNSLFLQGCGPVGQCAQGHKRPGVEFSF